MDATTEDRDQYFEGSQQVATDSQSIRVTELTAREADAEAR
jgi:hypothetical protein